MLTDYIIHKTFVQHYLLSFLESKFINAISTVQGVDTPNSHIIEESTV